MPPSVSGFARSAGHVRRVTMPNLIKYWRQKRGISGQQLAELIGSTQPQVHRLETGKLRLKVDQMGVIAQALGVAPQDLLAPRMIPLVGYVGAGGEVEYLDDSAKGAGLDEVPAPPGADPQTVAVGIRGTSMHPVYRDGWVLYYSAHCQPVDLLGQDCVVRLADGRTMLKRLLRGSTAGHFNLESYNGAAIEDVPLEWAAAIDFIDPRGAAARAIARSIR